MPKQQERVLGVLACADRDFACYDFRALMRRTRLTRKEVRRACRALARKGLAEFHRGLFTEDGEMAGSGYCASDAGREAWDKPRPASEEAR